MVLAPKFDLAFVDLQFSFLIRLQSPFGIRTPNPSFSLVVLDHAIFFNGTTGG